MDLYTILLILLKILFLLGGTALFIFTIWYYEEKL